VSITAKDGGSDPFELGRFLEAQSGVYADALRELRDGLKRSHWMWFVFPQVSGLGSSSMARRFAIGSLAEAHTYLRHPVLGVRLLECTQAVNGLAGRTAHQIFGSPDDMKFRSSMTLFEQVPGANAAFSLALDKYYGGQRDAATLQLLESAG
jgi:uncharacterized protein (DUF1810 family)